MLRVLAPHGRRFRRGLWAAHSCIRVLSQFIETARLECASGPDAVFKKQLETEVGLQLFSPECSVLWRGTVRVESETGLRLIMTSDSLVVLRQRKGFLSWYPWEAMVRWRAFAEGSLPPRLSVALISAHEGASDQLLYGVHIIVQGGQPSSGVDLRFILRDKLASTALLSWAKVAKKPSCWFFGACSSFFSCFFSLRSSALPFWRLQVPRRLPRG